VRKKTIISLGTIRDRRHVPPDENSGDPLLTGDTNAVNHLIGALESVKDDEDRILLIRALGVFKDPEVNRVLVTQFRHTLRRDIKKLISAILSETGDEKTVDSLIKILQTSKFDYERLVLIETLGNLKNPRAVELLVALLEKTKEADVKEAVMKALVKIGRSQEKTRPSE
jgi:HEAT repeat protein